MRQSHTASSPLLGAPDTRGTLRSLAFALVLGLALFASLPFMDWLTPPPATGLRLVGLDTVPPPPPPLPATAAPPPPATATASRALPRLAETRRALSVADTLPMRVNLEAGPGDFDVHFPTLGARSLDFPVVAGGAPPALRAADFVFDLSEADAPPRPIARVPPLYPPKARLRRVEGEVLVEFVVTASGAVTEPRVLYAQPPDMFEATALQAIGRWRFEPGVKDGKPVAVRVRQKLTFKLES